CKSSKIAPLQLVNSNLGGKLKLFNGIRVKNEKYELPGDVGEECCGNCGTRSNEKLKDFSR
ncbi:12686_t:CDS:1, partial [Dentiscutata erythropus]